MEDGQANKDVKKEGGAGKDVSASSLRDLATVSSIGIAIGVSTGLGFLFGRYMDSVFGTRPTLTIVFILLGIAGGFWNAYKTIKKYAYKD